jgi:hypothetical protein
MWALANTRAYYITELIPNLKGFTVMLPCDIFRNKAIFLTAVKLHSFLSCALIAASIK